MNPLRLRERAADGNKIRRRHTFQRRKTSVYFFVFCDAFESHHTEVLLDIAFYLDMLEVHARILTQAKSVTQVAGTWMAMHPALSALVCNGPRMMLEPL